MKNKIGSDQKDAQSLKLRWCFRCLRKQYGGPL